MKFKRNDIIGSTLRSRICKMVCTISLLAMLSCCSSIEINTYKAPEFGKQKIKKMAIMPIVITSSAQTRVSGSYSPSWIVETFTTAALSPAEYYPAEQEFLNAISRRFNFQVIVPPSGIDKAMKGKHMQTYNDALLEVIKQFKADAVISFRIRDTILRAGSMVEGRSAAIGHVDMTLYDSKGAPLWSISSEAFYRRGTTSSNAPPPMSSFVKFIMEQHQNALDDLAKQIQP
jgi:hypothetical protein